GRSCVQTSFYHVGKITMDFFLGVQLHFTINQQKSWIIFLEIVKYFLISFYLLTDKCRLCYCLFELP
ncbi:hypothetical protein, partial [Muriventricola aceti]|uniref:hypothetical protein n=1 Tax=Muriventricola aceti TaxID=2981773 RepID=UPI0021CF6DB9